ncbi:hypothetical protein TNCV_3990651 [Trichonephila clavipes]|uniref:Uncharacterized protein n=1 Tax=Trichonephila clavipes TaxID=2585209 RepID=A0A8X6T5Z6_TRICX|nr:hypothetical protein TNCV_3990651 [Trichonephila clavipes]
MSLPTSSKKELHPSEAGRKLVPNITRRRLFWRGRLSTGYGTEVSCILSIRVVSSESIQKPPCRRTDAHPIFRGLEWYGSLESTVPD